MRFLGELSLTNVIARVDKVKGIDIVSNSKGIYSYKR